jgi:hypothetical protein
MFNIGQRLTFNRIRDKVRNDKEENYQHGHNDEDPADYSATALFLCPPPFWFDIHDHLFVLFWVLSRQRNSDVRF